jgi:hypothetical protein
MKIALCLSGQPRCVKEGYEYYKKNLLDHYDVDVFCHVWDTAGAEHIAAYKPVTLMIEKPPTNDLSKYTRVPPPQPNWKVKNPALSTYAQLYAIKKCNELKSVYEEDNNIDKSIYGKYLVVATRHMIRANQHETVVELVSDSLSASSMSEIDVNIKEINKLKQGVDLVFTSKSNESDYDDAFDIFMA